MTEDDLLTFVMGHAKTRGWTRVHFRPAQLPNGRYVTAYDGDRGFPDVVLARDGRVLHVELKADKGRMGPGQREWGVALGETWRLWRPTMLPEIVKELQ